LKKEKKVNKKKKLCRPTVPNFFGDVSGNKEHFFTPYITPLYRVMNICSVREESTGVADDDSGSIVITNKTRKTIDAKHQRAPFNS